jgi:hypothetical protein
MQAEEKITQLEKLKKKSRRKERQRDRDVTLRHGADAIVVLELAVHAVAPHVTHDHVLHADARRLGKFRLDVADCSGGRHQDGTLHVMPRDKWEKKRKYTMKNCDDVSRVGDWDLKPRKSEVSSAKRNFDALQLLVWQGEGKMHKRIECHRNLT